MEEIRVHNNIDLLVMCLVMTVLSAYRIFLKNVSSSQRNVKPRFYVCKALSQDRMADNLIILAPRWYCSSRL